MKILVVSDSHGDLAALQAAVNQVQPDCVLHLGDHWRDAQALRAFLGDRPLYAVPGNCDYGVHAQDQLLLALEGVRIYMEHGHQHGVKRSPLRAILAAQEADAQLLLFGHTHRALCVSHEGLWVLNPGACSGARPTCGVIELSGGICCRIHEIGGDRI